MHRAVFIPVVALSFFRCPQRIRTGWLNTPNPSDELVFLGDEKSGYVKVQGSSSEGWVKKTLVVKK